MFMNNGTRIGRLPLSAGPFDNYHHHHHRHLTTKTALSLSSSTTTSSSPSASKTITKDLCSPTSKKRHHRSCRSSCHSSSTISSSSSSSLSSSSSSSSLVSNSNHGLELGQKVTVSSMNALGTIRFIGTTSFKPGTWVGIELDIIGTGKNNGAINGVRYFDCPPETGLFTLAKRVIQFNQAASSTTTNVKSTLAVSPRKSFTTTTTTARPRRTKTPMELTSPSTKTIPNNPRQRCLSHDHHQTHKSTTVSSASPKRKPLTASLSTKASRPQSRTEILSTTTIGHKLSSTTSSVTCNKAPLSTSTTRKLATPVISSPSDLPSIKQHHSKSTRKTVTPTTNTIKKRNSSLTSSTTTKHTLQGPETPRKSKSTSTRQVVTQDELKKMHLLLEQSRQEKQRLSDEMNGKEAVWERLVTAKESYALKVQDLQKEITRLQVSLQHSQEHVAQLELQLTQYKSSSSSGCTLNSPRGGDPSSSVGGVSGGGGMYSVNIMEQQYIQRIEKLDRLVQEWQQDAQNSHQQIQQQQRTYTAQIEQLRRDITERDQATAAMELDYEAAKQANADTIRQYEATLVQWTAEREEAMASKDNHISRLDQVIHELKACHFLLPPSPNNEDEEDDEGGLFDIGYGVNTTGITDLNDGPSTNSIERTALTTGNNGGTQSNSNIYSSRRRLEQQLELTTMALEDIQQKHKTVTLENEQLREQLKHMHAASGAVDQQFRQLQRELSVEVRDKRMVMEERDMALQSQLRMEDHYKDLVMNNTRLEQQLEQQQSKQEKLLVVENEFAQLQRQHSLLLQQMHDAASTEKQQQQQQQQQQQASDYSKGYIRGTEDQMQDGMKNDLNQQLHQLNHDENTDTNQLQRVIADMTLVMEEKTLRITELEKDLYHAEQHNTYHPYTWDPQQRLRLHNHNTTAVALTSPMCSGIIMPISPISDTPTSAITYTFSPPSRANSRSGHNGNLASFGDMSLMAAMNKEKAYSRNSVTYCVNCDLFDTHTTMDCPTQDETY